MAAIGFPDLAKRADPPSGRDRVDLRAEPDWIARVQRQADRLGISLSAYIRQATSRQLEQDEATDPAQRDD
jgi:hypothetical protein